MVRGVARIPLTALTLWTTLAAAAAGPGVVDVQRDALGDGDPGLLDAAVGGEEHGSGGGDAGLGAVAEQAGEPVVGEPGGGGLHEQEVLGGGGARGDAQPGPGHGGDAGPGDARGGECRHRRRSMTASGAASTTLHARWGCAIHDAAASPRP